MDECSSIETALAVAHAAWGTVAHALFRGLSAYILLLAPWIREDVGEWAVRLPSALAGIALVPVGWILGHQVGGRPLAWRLGLALVASPFFVWHSREARWYPLAWLLAGLGAICFVRALASRGWPDLTGCLGFGLAAALTFPPAVTVLLLQVAWIVAARLARREHVAPSPPAARGLRLARALLITAPAALAAAWSWTALLSPALRSGPKGFGFSHLGGPRVGAVLYSPVALATGYTLGPGPLEWHARPARLPGLLDALAMTLGVVILLGLLVLGFRTIRESAPRGTAAALLSLGIVPPLIIVGASLWTGHRFAPRYVGASFLYLLCLAAAGTLGTGPRWIPGKVLGAALLLLQSASLVNLHTSTRYRREDVRSAAGYVSRAATPEDRVLVFGGIGPPWKHYYRGDAPSDVVLVHPARGWTRERIEERVREARDVFVVRGLILGEPGEEPLLAALEELTDPIEAHPFDAIEVLRRRSPSGAGEPASKPTGP